MSPPCPSGYPAEVAFRRARRAGALGPQSGGVGSLRAPRTARTGGGTSRSLPRATPSRISLSGASSSSKGSTLGVRPAGKPRGIHGMPARQLPPPGRLEVRSTFPAASLTGNIRFVRSRARSRCSASESGRRAGLGVVDPIPWVGKGTLWKRIHRPHRPFPSPGFPSCRLGPPHPSCGRADPESLRRPRVLSAELRAGCWRPRLADILRRGPCPLAT